MSETTTTKDCSAAMLLELHHQRLDETLVEIELMADAENWPGRSGATRDFAGRWRSTFAWKRR